MDALEELTKQVEILEELLKEEKVFRERMEKIVEWEKRRVKIECEAFRNIACNKMLLARHLSDSLDRVQDELLELQVKYRILKEKYDAA
jgi:hypothetical protein